MRGFVALVGKEWRDVRGIAIAFAACVLAGALLLPWSFPHGELAAMTAGWLLPVEVFLFSGMLAADVVAVDCSTHRIHALALLPVPLRRVWTAKVAALAAATAIFVVWALACHALGLALLGREGSVAAFLDVAPKVAWLLIPIVTTNCGVLFVATWLDRSFAAFVLGVFVTAGVVAGSLCLLVWTFGGSVAQLPELRRLSLQPHLLVVIVGETAVLLAASFAAFVRGGIHWAPRWRRAAVGCGALVLLAGTAHAGTYGWARCVWLALAPGDRDAAVALIAASPDGRRLAMSVVKAERPYGAAARVWVLEVDGGELREIGSLGTWLPWESWSTEGALGLARGDRDENVSWWTDAASGATLPSATSPRMQAKEWARTKSSSAERRTRTHVTWIDRDVTGEVDGVEGARTYASLPGAVFYKPDPLHFVRRDLATGEERTLLTATREFSSAWWLSPDAKRFSALVDGDWTVFDASSGERIALPELLRGSSVWWTRRGSRLAMAMRNDPPGTNRTSFTLVDLNRGGLLPLGTIEGGTWSSPQAEELPDGRVIAMNAEGAIVLFDVELRPIRPLYERRTD